MGMIKNAKALEVMVRDITRANLLLEDIHEILEELEEQPISTGCGEKLRKVKARICQCLDY